MDICSKLELINPIKKPNNANVKATKTRRKTINIGCITLTSTKNKEVIKITTPTIKVLVAPEPTNAKTTSNVEMGAASIS